MSPFHALSALALLGIAAPAFAADEDATVAPSDEPELTDDGRAERGSSRGGSARGGGSRGGGRHVTPSRGPGRGPAAASARTNGSRQAASAERSTARSGGSHERPENRESNGQQAGERHGDKNGHANGHGRPATDRERHQSSAAHHRAPPNAHSKATHDARQAAHARARHDAAARHAAAHQGHHARPHGRPGAPPPRYYRYPHVRPWHGVFVYGPPPRRHASYHGAGPHRVPAAQMPDRTIDRDNSLAVGLRAGSIYGGYDNAAGYADLGAGFNVRYRPDEAVGLELAVQHYDQTWDSLSERQQTVGQASVELFAWPWTRVSPYALAGLTWDSRNFNDTLYDTSVGEVSSYAAQDVRIGPHVGLGLEFALGKTVALDLEARYASFLGTSVDDATLPGALQTTAGVMVHF